MNSDSTLTIRSLKLTIDDLRKERDSFKDQLDQMSLEKEGLEKKYTKLKSLKKQRKQERETTFEEHNQAQDEMKSKIKSLQDQLSEASHKLTEQQKEYNQKLELKVEKSVYEKLEQQNKDLSAQLGNIRTEKDVLEQENLELIKEKESLEQQVKDLELAQMAGHSNVTFDKQIRYWIELIDAISEDQQKKYSTDFVRLYARIRKIVQVLRPDWLKSSEMIPSFAEKQAYVDCMRSHFSKLIEEANENDQTELANIYLDEMKKYSSKKV